ncbi:MAG: hypothetical protein ACRYFZ_25335 [Janthinobacterium lividum]
MTRSTLLQLLAHPAALTGADVRELEQLAHAFPYCQTAHLLLAKAAHDQGSMLAGQRLRRAATYATNRVLLRQLIEQPALAEAVVAEAAPTLLAGADPVLLTTDSAPAAESQPALIEPEAPLFEVEHTVLPKSAPEEVPAKATPEPTTEPQAEATLASPATTEAAPEIAAHLPRSESVAVEEAPETELPAQAPPIRPPAGAAAARLEFGLAEAEPAEIVAYQLPELLEPAPALSSDSPVVTLAASVLATALPAFAGVADVGYAPGEGSRLGFCLQSPAAETYSLTSGPAALLPSSQLPPASEFFAPDALLLAHLATHQLPAAPVLPPIPSDLINSFLRRGLQGVTRRRAVPPLPDAEDEEQPDLSGPSTQVVPDLASENLAKILVRQGKPDRAIAIYERLMVKHPEKMAYFAAQIDSLRPQA